MTADDTDPSSLAVMCLVRAVARPRIIPVTKVTSQPALLTGVASRPDLFVNHTFINNMDYTAVGLCCKLLQNLVDSITTQPGLEEIAVCINLDIGVLSRDAILLAKSLIVIVINVHDD